MRQFMLGLLSSVVVTSAGYAETAPADVMFEEGAVAQSLTGAPGNAEEGATVISTRALGNCVACHSISAMPDAAFQGNVGPSLDGAGGRWSEAQLRGIVSDAKMTFEGTIMPSFYKTGPYIRPGDAFTGKAPEGDLAPMLTGQQIEDVVAYLMTLSE
jgi:sulfur-oxidizing protein SoxX